ncbi:MAG: hypothetical protein LCH98_19815 [Actinobacteria bacterium]|nr:hypothetical protein [Actinomycetota bacterium]
MTRAVPLGRGVADAALGVGTLGAVAGEDAAVEDAVVEGTGVVDPDSVGMLDRGPAGLVSVAGAVVLSTWVARVAPGRDGTGIVVRGGVAVAGGFTVGFVGLVGVGVIRGGVGTGTPEDVGLGACWPRLVSAGLVSALLGALVFGGLALGALVFGVLGVGAPVGLWADFDALVRRSAVLGLVAPDAAEPEPDVAWVGLVAAVGRVGADGEVEPDGLGGGVGSSEPGQIWRRASRMASVGVGAAGARSCMVGAALEGAEEAGSGAVTPDVGGPQVGGPQVDGVEVGVSAGAVAVGRVAAGRVAAGRVAVGSMAAGGVASGGVAPRVLGVLARVGEVGVTRGGRGCSGAGVTPGGTPGGSGAGGWISTRIGSPGWTGITTTTPASGRPAAVAVEVATGSGAATGWVAVTGPDVSTGSGAGVPPGVDCGVGAGVGTAVAQPEGLDAAAVSGATVGVAARRGVGVAARRGVGVAVVGPGSGGAEVVTCDAGAASGSVEPPDGPVAAGVDVRLRRGTGAGVGSVGAGGGDVSTAVRPSGVAGAAGTGTLGALAGTGTLRSGPPASGSGAGPEPGMLAPGGVGMVVSAADAVPAPAMTSAVARGNAAATETARVEMWTFMCSPVLWRGGVGGILRGTTGRRCREASRAPGAAGSWRPLGW